MFAGTWRSHIVSPAKRFVKIDSDVPTDIAAMTSVNPPTAYRMMKDFVTLKPGIVDYYFVEMRRVGDTLISHIHSHLLV